MKNPTCINTKTPKPQNPIKLIWMQRHVKNIKYMAYVNLIKSLWLVVNLSFLFFEFTIFATSDIISIIKIEETISGFLFEAVISLVSLYLARKLIWNFTNKRFHNIMGSSSSAKYRTFFHSLGPKYIDDRKNPNSMWHHSFK